MTVVVRKLSTNSTPDGVCNSLEDYLEVAYLSRVVVLHMRHVSDVKIQSTRRRSQL